LDDCALREPGNKKKESRIQKIPFPVNTVI
jgi:hypothetical protein